MRRGITALNRRSERRMIDQLNDRPAILSAQFSTVSPDDLVSHFKVRESPRFFPGFNEIGTQKDKLNAESTKSFSWIHAEADRITRSHCWLLFGHLVIDHGASIDWLRDPLSGKRWPAEYHADIDLKWEAGSDIRILWELNRFGHALTLAQAFALTGDELYANEFFSQVELWLQMNPVGKGPNWVCAMEVAIRAINLAASFQLLRHSKSLDRQKLDMMLRLFDSHGRHIKRNLEFSYLITSNHYLSDVAGLLWLGVLLPELAGAAQWREFGLKELLAELEKQVLNDGVDFESSTGYHRLALELFLYSFCLCRVNDIQIASHHWIRLERMVNYLRAYLRPDGRAPLIGDNDSGRILPLAPHAGDDHSYLLDLAAVAFENSRFKTDAHGPAAEVAWLFGSAGVVLFNKLAASESPSSEAFEDGGIYILRDSDLYLLLNASDSGAKGRGSHGHNDALSIELSAFGTSFIADPGVCAYTSDLDLRNSFRSTAYHSTVEIDGFEQNEIHRDAPFVIGNDARPSPVDWSSTPDFDEIAAEHFGYSKLRHSVIHRRAVRFDKRREFWFVDDSFSGEGEHEFKFRFHFAPGINVTNSDDSILEASDSQNEPFILLATAGSTNVPMLENLYSSRDYGMKQESTAACWTIHDTVPFSIRWVLVPGRNSSTRNSAMDLITRLCRPVNTEWP